MAPLGALFVAGTAAAAGHEVRSSTWPSRPRCAERSAARCESAHCQQWAPGPDVIGVSIRNLDNCLYARPVSYFAEVHRVVVEIEGVHRSTGAASFYFTDGVFKQPREHALALCAALARRHLPIGWMAYANPLGSDRELAHAMAEAGCVGVELGCDAATDKMLAALGKPFGTAELRACLEATAHAKLPCAVHLLFGGPGETPADIEEAQRFLASCPTPNAVFASLGLRICAGTPLEGLARREGILAEGADLFEPAYYVSEALGKDPMKAPDAVARRRPEWSTPTDWTRPLMRAVQAIVNWRGVRPQWRDIRNYGKYMRW